MADPAGERDLAHLLDMLLAALRDLVPAEDASPPSQE